MGEAGGFFPSDVETDDDGNETLHVHRTISRTLAGSYEVVNTTKTEAGNRYIPLNEAASKAFHDQMLINKGMHRTEKDGLELPVFMSPNGTLIRSSRLIENIGRICDEAGIDHFAAHAFRDTFATRCVEANMDVKQLQDILGHTDVKMTLGLYAHANEKRKADQIKDVKFT